MFKLYSKSSVILYFRLLSYVRRYWAAFAIAMVGNVLYSSVDAGLTYMLKPILNKGFIARDLHFIHWLPCLIVGVFIVRGVSNCMSNYFMALVSRGVVMDFRQNIFTHLLKLPATYYDNTTSGQVLSAVIYNVEQVANAGSDALTTFVQSVCYIIGLLVVMFTISWQLSLFFLITVPLVAWVVRKSSKRLRRIGLSVQDQMGDVMSIAEEGIEGYKVIRAYGGQDYETQKFYKATFENRKRELKMVVTKALSVSSVQLIAAFALAITVYLATSHVGALRLSAGSFVSLIAAMVALLKPLKNFTNVNAKIQRGLAGAQSVFALLDEASEKDTGTVRVEKVQGVICYDSVSFVYPKTEKQVLENVGFTIEPGQKVALVGHSGGGKTTIINLLQRFYEVETGQITIDGLNIKEYVLTDLRRQFASVSQHVTLFNDTIAHNIAYGHAAEANEEEIITAAKAANIWGFIEQLPEGLNTLIGENGVLLSGGQRQRIAIARALLKQSPILILDEATSALDTESERQIQDALEKLMQKRTTLIIAHRLSTIEKADVILVIENGRVIESGNHKILLEKSGYYAKLYKMQFRTS